MGGTEADSVITTGRPEPGAVRPGGLLRAFGLLRERPVALTVVGVLTVAELLAGGGRFADLSRSWRAGLSIDRRGG